MENQRNKLFKKKNIEKAKTQNVFDELDESSREYVKAQEIVKTISTNKAVVIKRQEISRKIPTSSKLNKNQNKYEFIFIRIK